MVPHDKSSALISNILPNDNYPTLGGIFYAFDNSTIEIAHSESQISLLGNAVLNASSLHNRSIVTMYKNSKTTIKNSNFSALSCFEQSQAYLLLNTVVDRLSTYGQTNYPYCNAIIYKDGTSSILNPNLVDGAQIIDI